MKWLHDKLVERMPKEHRMEVFIYDRSTARSKRWLNSHETINFLESKGLKVNYVPVMPAYHAQAKLFFEHKLIIMPYGGHMGNVVFIQNGTLLLMMNCGGNPYRFSFIYPTETDKMLGLKHVMLTNDVLECDANHDHGNFRADPLLIWKYVQLYLDKKLNHRRVVWKTHDEIH